jgi:DNA polymerase
MIVYWDVETFSQCSVKERGAHIYASDPTTDIFFFSYAIDDGEVQVWRPGDPLPEPFANPTSYKFTSDNWEFERTIHAQILVKRYGFPPIPIENQDCAQRLALANAYPAELGLRCEALDLPYRKDPEARKAMLRLSRPQTAKKRKKPADPAARERDLALLLERCKNDVRATRAASNSPRLRPLLPEEREQLLLDAKINARGICANSAFLEAMRTLAVQERNAVNVRLNELTAGVVTSVDQVAKIKDAVNAHGHTMTSVNKRSVSATLAHQPDDFVRELLELRQRGAYASVRMAKRLLGYADPADDRIRGWGRIYGAGPGRWSSPGPQLHNLKRNDAEYPASLVDALIAGDYAELARYGNPLAVAAELSRAALHAKTGHVLVCGDLSAIESRIPAWFAGEEWKIAAFNGYDSSGDERLHPYRQTAARMLRKDVLTISKAERQLGKGAELACGFGGSVGAWRRIAHDEDVRSDAEVLAIIKQWRDAHPAIRTFWRELAQAARVAIRTGRPILVAAAPRPPIIAAFDGYALSLTLPSGRAINYPGARLSPNTKFEDGDPDIEFFDNARGQWKPARAWFGTLVENVVQGCARDLLAAALLRFEARGLPVVFHCHDEVVIEVPEDTVSEQEVLAILLDSPNWAAGLPLGGKVHSGPLYLEAPATGEPSPPKDEEIVERAVDAFVADAVRLPDTKEVEQGAEDDFLTSLGTATAPLTDFVSLPMDAGGRVSCPFHEDWEPSCRIYVDHFHCYGCGARGDRVEWLTRVEGMTKAEAIAALQDWSGPTSTDQQHDVATRCAFALEIWNAAQPIADTIGERYLSETRAIDVSKLPPTIHEALRFHPRCVFGARTYQPCLIALMRDPVTDAPIGVHRIGLAQEDGIVIKLDRMALGRMGVVKLWPMNGDGQLVIGEGIETVLAAATRISYRGAPLTPAWSAVAKGGLGRLPVLPRIERLVLLVDHDENGEGQRAAEQCRRIWKSANRITVPLIPKQRGWDFNDVVLGRKA